MLHGIALIMAVVLNACANLLIKFGVQGSHFPKLKLSLCTAFEIVKIPFRSPLILIGLFCFALNVGGVGSPAAGGRNVIMMGFWEGYQVPMDFFTWMKYGFPAVPVLGLVVAVFVLTLVASIGLALRRRGTAEAAKRQ